MHNVRRNVSASPFQAKAETLASKIYKEISLSPKADLDPDQLLMLQKYKVVKYLKKNNDGEPIEVWVYKPYHYQNPILEDQALKRAESIIQGAKKLFHDEKYSKESQHKLDSIMAILKSDIKKMYEVPLLTPAEQSKIEKEEKKACASKYKESDACIDHAIELLSLNKESMDQLTTKEKMQKLQNATNQLKNNTTKQAINVLLAQRDKINKEIREIGIKIKQKVLAPTFKKNKEKIKHLIQQLINDVAYTWGHAHPRSNYLKEKDYQHFYKNLWKAVEEAPSRYKNTNLLVFNEDPLVMSAQYYERGTQYTENAKLQTKAYRSSHQRDAVGVANFIAYATGHIDPQGYLTASNESKPEIMMTDVGFRHASLPPIDLYKEEKIVGGNHIDCVNATTQNFIALFKEMESRVSSKPTDINLINVSLLTVINDKDDQKRQFQDTILAADRLRSRHAAYKPITFDFGVQWTATGTVRSYPDAQRFENNRALFQLLKLCIGKLKQANANNPLLDSLEKSANDFYMLIEYNNEPFTADGVASTKEKGVLFFARLYDEAFNAYHIDSSPANQVALDDAERALNTAKESLYEFANKSIEALKNEIHALNLKELKIQASTIEVYYSLEALYNILDLYLNDKWHQLEYNFKLPAQIIELGSCLSKLESRLNMKGRTVTSWNCKSNNDRSSTMAAHVDILRAQHLNQALTYLDNKGQMQYVSSHYVGSAWAQHPILDTDGAGPKFGGDIVRGVIKDSGHPDDGFAEMQKTTSRWATHILAKKLPDEYVPKKIMFGATVSNQSILDAYEELNKKLMEQVLEYSKPNNTTEVTIDYINSLNQLCMAISKVINQHDYTYYDENYLIADINNEYFKWSAINKFPEPFAKAIRTVLIEFLKAVCSTKEEKADINPVSQVALDYNAWHDKVRKGLFKIISSDTQQVISAFRSYHELKNKQVFTRKDFSALFQEAQALKQVQIATQRWLDKKHGGSQFKTNKSNLTQPEYRPDSRLPEMLDLLNYVTQEFTSVMKDIKNRPELNDIFPSPVATLTLK